MAEFVRLEPGVVDELVAICNTMLEQLVAKREAANRLNQTHGNGDCETARQLAAR